MSAKQIKALKKKKYLIGAGILFVLLIILITSGAIKHNNDIVKTPEPVSLNKKQAVTKALQYTATKNNLNVRFYNENSDYQLAAAQLRSDNLDTITFLMYSDSCSICNHNIKKEQKLIKRLANKRNLVIAINDARNVKNIRKYFELPEYFHYPSLFTYTNRTENDDPNGKLIISTQELLYR